MSDASDKAWRAVVYGVNENHELNIIRAKSKLFLTTRASIPRAELYACGQAALMIRTQRKIFPTVPIIYMADAQAVLQQLSNQDVKTVPTVGKVIEAALKILGNTRVTYIPTGNNQANILTKRISKIREKLPQFFKPQLSDFCCVNIVREPQLFSQMWHFTFIKARNMIVWWIRFVNQTKRMDNRARTQEIIPLTRNELLEAEKRMIKDSI